MTSNLAGNLQLLAQFQVDTTHLLQGFTNNPVYAQPLYVSGLPSIGNPPATHNVVFVTTLNGEVYAFDADNTATPTKLWYRDETNTVSMQGLKHNCDVPSFPGQSLSGPLPYLDFAGVVSTPVVELDPTTGNPYAIYVANLCQKTSDNSEHWWLNALNLQTGATLGTVEIAYTSAQVAANPYGPQQPFFPRNQLQRPSLLLVHGTTSAGVAARTVVAAFGTMTNEMTKQYQGWIFPYDTTTPSSPVPQGNTSPYITQCYFPSETAAGGTPPCSCKDGTDAPPTGCATGNEPPPNADLKNPCGQGGRRVDVGPRTRRKHQPPAFLRGGQRRFSVLSQLRAPLRRPAAPRRQLSEIHQLRRGCNPDQPAERLEHYVRNCSVLAHRLLCSLRYPFRSE